METPSLKLERMPSANAPRRGLDREPFPYRAAYEPRQFVAPASSYKLTQKTRNGFGVSTSQLSSTQIGHRPNVEKPHTRAFRAAADRQLGEDIHYPSKRSCHMQSGYPATIVKLDPTYPFKPTEPPDPHAGEVDARRTFVKDNFRTTQPRLAASWHSEYASTVSSRRANSDKAHTCHIQFS